MNKLNKYAKRVQKYERRFGFGPTKKTRESKLARYHPYTRPGVREDNNPASPLAVSLGELENMEDKERMRRQDEAEYYTNWVKEKRTHIRAHPYEFIDAIKKAAGKQNKWLVQTPPDSGKGIRLSTIDISFPYQPDPSKRAVTKYFKVQYQSDNRSDGQVVNKEWKVWHIQDPAAPDKIIPYLL